MTDSLFVERCIDKCRDPERGVLFNLTMAKILLLPGFVETFFFVLHFQYLTLTPGFEVQFSGESSQDGAFLDNAVAGSEDRISITREQFCDTESAVEITHPGDIETWFGTRALVCDPSYEFISSHIGLFLIGSMMLGAALIAPMADLNGHKTTNLTLGVVLLVTFSILVSSKYFVEL